MIKAKRQQKCTKSRLQPLLLVTNGAFIVILAIWGLAEANIDSGRVNFELTYMLSFGSDRV
jgi:hypothetical protein